MVVDQSNAAVGVQAPATKPLVGLAAFMVVMAGLKVFSGQLAPLAVAFVIVVGVAPVQTAVKKRGGSNGLALTASILAGVGVLLTFLGSVVWAVYSVADLVTDPEYEEALAKLEESVTEGLQSLGVKDGAIQDGLRSLDLGNVMNTVTSALSGVVGVLSMILTIVLAMVFLMGDFEPFQRALRSVTNLRPAVVEGLDLFVIRTRSYLAVSAAFGAIVAVLDGVALWAMRVPLVGVWVVLSFVSNFIPNVGFIIGVVPPAFLALLLNGPGSAVWVVIIYSALNFVIQTLIQPRYVGDSVGLSTTLTFFSLIFWTFVMGPLGAILAIPLSLFARAVLIDIYPERQWIGPLLSLSAASQDPEAVEPDGGASGDDGGATSEQKAKSKDGGASDGDD